MDKQETLPDGWDKILNEVKNAFNTEDITGSFVLMFMITKIVATNPELSHLVHILMKNENGDLTPDDVQAFHNLFEENQEEINSSQEDMNIEDTPNVSGFMQTIQASIPDSNITEDIMRQFVDHINDNSLHDSVSNDDDFIKALMSFASSQGDIVGSIKEAKDNVENQVHENNQPTAEHEVKNNEEDVVENPEEVISLEKMISSKYNRPRIFDKNKTNQEKKTEEISSSKSYNRKDLANKILAQLKR